MSNNLADLCGVSGWGVSFAESMLETSSRVTYRYVLVDDSRSMTKLDGVRIQPARDQQTRNIRYHHQPWLVVVLWSHMIMYMFTHLLASSILSIVRFEECSRFDEAVSTAGMIATVSDAADTPAEIRLINNKAAQQPRTVGCGKDGGVNLSAVMAQLDIEPSSAKTPICRQLREISEQLRRFDAKNRKVAMLILLVDGTATDGDVMDMLKPLEGLPLQIIVRIYTDERDVVDYWHHVGACVDLDVKILGNAMQESKRVAELNPWLNYGEPLHRAREFGVAISAIDSLSECSLNRKDMRTVVEFLLLRHDTNQQKIGGGFPDPDTDWIDFVAAVGAAVDSQPPVFCPLQKRLMPWINMEALINHEEDKAKDALFKNEALLWKVYLFFAYRNQQQLRPASASSSLSTASSTTTPGYASPLTTSMSSNYGGNSQGHGNGHGRSAFGANLNHSYNQSSSSSSNNRQQPSPSLSPNLTYPPSAHRSNNNNNHNNSSSSSSGKKFRTPAKYAKRILHEDDFWQLIEHFKLVPGTTHPINTPYQHTPQYTSYQYTLPAHSSIYPINTPLNTLNHHNPQ